MPKHSLVSLADARHDSRVIRSTCPLKTKRAVVIEFVQSWLERNVIIIIWIVIRGRLWRRCGLTLPLPVLVCVKPHPDTRHCVALEFRFSWVQRDPMAGPVIAIKFSRSFCDSVEHCLVQHK